MSVRAKTIWITASLMLSAMVTILLVTQFILISGFERVEREQVLRNLNRAVDAIANNQQKLLTDVADWSFWGETYNFVLDHNPEYMENNLNPDGVTGQALNYLLFFDRKNRLVQATGYDIESQEELPVPKRLLEILKPGSQLIGGKELEGKSGIVMLPEGPLMLASRPVLKDDRSGPQAGTLVFAYFIDEPKVKEIAEVAHVNMSVYPYDGDMPADVAAFKKDPKKEVVQNASANKTAGYAVVKDALGQPGLVVKIEQPRDIYTQGRQTILYFIFTIILMAIVLSVVLAWTLNFYVSGPLARLSAQVNQIKTHARSFRVDIPKRQDEIGNLSLSINAMLGKLEAAQNGLEREKSLVEKKVVERTKQLAEAQAELAASVSSLPFGFAVISPQDEILHTNKLLNKMVGETIPEERSKTKRALAAIDAKFKPVTNILDDIHAVQKDGKPIERNISYGQLFLKFLFVPVVTKIEDVSQTIGTVVVLEDVTDERMLQRSRDEFFSIASHELRTPLTAIRGNTSLIQQYFDKDIKDPLLKEMIGDIHDGSERLIRIVNDFLDTSRLELGKLRFNNEPLVITDLLGDVVKQFDVTGSRKQLKIELEKPVGELPMVRADKERVRQIIINLVGNSIKFTDKGSIKVAATRDGNKVRISVRDTGEGIPENLQKLLFRKFQQANDNILTRDGVSGTGLGLYISKMLAKGMHGELYLVESKVGEGSCFALELPVA